MSVEIACDGPRASSPRWLRFKNSIDASAARDYADKRLNPEKPANDVRRDDDKVVALPDRTGDRNAKPAAAGEPAADAAPAGPLELRLAQIRAVYPHREIVTVPADVLFIAGGGGPHCITQQVPAGAFAGE